MGAGERPGKHRQGRRGGPGRAEGEGRGGKPDLDGHKTPEAWAKEGAELARHAVYLDGELLKGPDPSEGVLQEPADYAPVCRRVARIQDGKAGKRLADKVGTLLQRPESESRPGRSSAAMGVYCATREIYWRVMLCNGMFLHAFGMHWPPAAGSGAWRRPSISFHAGIAQTS
jgi:hypothetical protein